MRVRSLVAALALVVTLGAPRAAMAAPSGPPSPAAVAEARKLFDSGLKLYGEGSYREALAAFLRANELSPRASLQRNIAQCNRDLKDFTGAYDAYQTLLTKYGGTMSAADRRPIERAIAELALLTGTVRVTVTEPGATVSIDGHEVGATPLAAPVRVNLGPHTVAVSKAGFEPLQREIKLSGGDEATVEGPLQPEVTTGHLVVNAPAQARVEVLVDGADMGPAPWEGDIKPGVHVVEARSTDRSSAPKQVEVVRRERVEVVLELKGRTGRVQIDTHTADAAISVDGQPVGRGVWEGELPAGEHRVAIAAPGFRSYTRAFLVHEGETFVEDTRLVSEDGSVPRYDGAYAGLAFFGFATPSGASNEIAQHCPIESTGTCPWSSPLGAGLAVRVGYSFGWIAAEGVALGSYDYSSTTVTFPMDVPSGDFMGPARQAVYGFHRFGGGGAIGVRVASKNPHVRLTASALGGIVAMGNIYTRTTTQTSDMNPTPPQPDTYSSHVETYAAPLLLFDAGVLVGWANGAKLHASIVTMIQLVPDDSKATRDSPTQFGSNPIQIQNPELTVAQGPQVFVGPMLGFDLGL
jgi:hypothetical protein